MRARMMSGETIHTDSHRSAWRDDQLHLQSEYVTCMIVDSFFFDSYKTLSLERACFQNVQKSKSTQRQKKSIPTVKVKESQIRKFQKIKKVNLHRSDFF